MQVTPGEQACGAEVTGINLAEPLSADVVQQLRSAWVEHQVLSFPDQNINDDDLERFTLYFGAFGDDPFIAPVAGRQHVLAVQRLADEKAPVFAETWHTDWSFQSIPPDGTCLYGITIPPQGGDTLFANQQKALAEMPIELRQRIQGLQALHTAKAAYAPEGAYGSNDQQAGRSMAIQPSDSANETRLHPLVRRHPESGIDAIYGCLGYILGIDGMEDTAAFELLAELHDWQSQPQFQYCHKWQASTLLMWDNRSVLHKATAGYDGYDRLLHRTTIAGTVF